MAVYATKAQFVSVVGERTALAIADRDNDDEVDTDLVNAALSDASEMIDGYITNYLPNLVVVPSLTRACIMLANELVRLSEQSTEDSRLNYDRVIKWLKDVQSGVATLPGQPNTDDGQIDPGDPLVVAGERVWDRVVAARLF